VDSVARAFNLRTWARCFVCSVPPKSRYIMACANRYDPWPYWSPPLAVTGTKGQSPRQYQKTSLAEIFRNARNFIVVYEGEIQRSEKELVPFFKYFAS
jgi:hypothetical protein